MRKQQKGFTLIELVLVIIVLGVLAATAVPKFVDLKGEAEANNVEVAQRGVEAALAIAIAKHATNAPVLNDVISYVKAKNLTDTVDTDGTFDLVIGSKTITVQGRTACDTAEVNAANDNTDVICNVTFTVL